MLKSTVLMPCLKIYYRYYTAVEHVYLIYVAMKFSFVPNHYFNGPPISNALLLIKTCHLL